MNNARYKYSKYHSLLLNELLCLIHIIEFIWFPLKTISYWLLSMNFIVIVTNGGGQPKRRLVIHQLIQLPRKRGLICPPPTFKCTFFHGFFSSYFFFAIGLVWNVCLYCLFEIFWNYCDISIFLLMAFKDMIRSVILFVWIVLWSNRMGVFWVRHFVCKHVVLKYSFMTLQSIYTVWKIWP